MARVGLVLTLAITLSSAYTPEVAFGQDDVFNTAHATLRGWEERARLAIFDRGGSFFGRLSDQGILQRFNPEMDPEYPLDLISSSFSLGETYEWYRRDNGVRFRAGSISHLRLVQNGDFKAMVPLGRSWATHVRFNHDETLQANRNLIRLEFRKEMFEERGRTFLTGTLKAEKPETDLELGFTWRPPRGEVTVAVAALDVFSNFIYQSLEVDPSVADTALDYTSLPFTARLSLDLDLGRRFRIEAHGLALTPTSVVAESQSNPGDGFAQDERYAYAGGLLEWAPSARVAFGGFATWVRARLDRSPLPMGQTEDALDLTEKTWQLGVYGIHPLGDRFTAEGWLTRVWRSEDRLHPPAAGTSDIRYEDRSWAGRLNLTYRARSGFRSDLGIDFVARDIVGTDRLPGAFDADNSRLRLDLGWTFAARALLILGGAFDLSGGGGSSRFDGAHGRFILYW
ncbi:MAG: hypothetical protein JSW46_08830 [Gemmatimonadota bacterium]|nr:MAG: hypothetical protein JSW46_08830 [Gemmatimonadota bacterium]